MDIFQSIILGILQGLGEFLPISSTAHLILAPYFFNWPDPGLAFDVALHVGTLIAVVTFFWRDWLEIFASACNSIFHTKYKIQNTKYNSSLPWLLVAASIPGAVLGFLFEDYAETIFRHPLIIATTLFILGLVLYLADKYVRHRKDIRQLNFKDSLIIGLSQAVAIIPGVSRSGATMTAGLMLGLNRSDTAKFSFLLSTPIIFGAAVLKVPELIDNGINLPTLLGILVAAISGFLAIKYMLKFIEKVSYKIFFWYRLILAGLIVAVYFLR